MNTGLLIVRLLLGAALAAHGAQKLFGWFGGYGLAGPGGFLESLGFRPGKLFALAAGLGEAGGGVLVALGILGPVGPALIVTTMLVAIYTVHWTHGFFAQSNGFELPLANATAALAIAFAGFGAYALDSVIGLDLSQPVTAWIAIAAAVVLSLVSLAVRRPPAPKPAGAGGHA